MIQSCFLKWHASINHFALLLNCFLLFLNKFKSFQLKLNMVKAIAKGFQAENKVQSETAPFMPEQMGDTRKTQNILSATSLILIGSSTGGPKVLSKILSALPKEINSAIIVIQHIDSKFADSFANWLNEQSKLKVEIAKEGAEPEMNLVYLAGANGNLTITQERRFRYVDEINNNYYRPSIDIFFNSIAKNWLPKGLAILLTGMGADGANGLLSLKKMGWHTIAQDEASSLVYGMPKAAAKLEAAKEVLSIESITAAILKFIETRRN